MRSCVSLAALRLARENPGQTLQATALVHEAYLRLVDADHGQRWDSRGHFFAAAAEAMRRILVENARRKRRLKHGGCRVRVPLDLDHLVVPEPDKVPDGLLALDEALGQLADVDPSRRAGQAPLLRRPDDPPSRGGTRRFAPDRRPLLGLRPRLAEDGTPGCTATVSPDDEKR